MEYIRKTVARKCIWCRKEFYPYLSDVKRGSFAHYSVSTLSTEELILRLSKEALRDDYLKQLLINMEKNARCAGTLLSVDVYHIKPRSGGGFGNFAGYRY